MAEDLAKLQVKLEAQADEYVKEIKRADSETKRAVASMTKETERLKKQSSSMLSMQKRMTTVLSK